MRVLSVMGVLMWLGPVQAEPLHAPGWGLPAEIAAERLDGAIVPVEPPRQYVSSLEAPLLSRHVRYAGLDWRVWIQTGPDRRLRQLLFQPERRQIPGFVTMLERLRARYGPETRLCQRPSGEAEAVWQRASGVLHLSRWPEAVRTRIGPNAPTPQTAPQTPAPGSQVFRERPQIREVPLVPERLPDRTRPDPPRLVEPGETAQPRPVPQVTFPPPSQIGDGSPRPGVAAPDPRFRRAALAPTGRIVLRVHDPARVELASRRCPPR